MIPEAARGPETYYSTPRSTPLLDWYLTGRRIAAPRSGPLSASTRLAEELGPAGWRHGADASDSWA